MAANTRRVSERKEHAGREGGELCVLDLVVFERDILDVVIFRGVVSVRDEFVVSAVHFGTSGKMQAQARQRMEEMQRKQYGGMGGPGGMGGMGGQQPPRSNSSGGRKTYGDASNQTIDVDID